MTQGKINILDLRDSPWVDGPGRTILECAENICKERFRIVIGAFDSGRIDGTPYEHAAQEKKLDIVRVREKNAFDYRVLKQIVSFIRLYDINILHTHEFRSNLVGIAAAKLLRRPIVITVHGWITNDKKSKFKAVIDKWLACQCNHIIAVSKATKERIGNKIKDDFVTVIPNALRLEQFNPAKPFGKLRKSLCINPNEIVIANIGRLSPEKGQELFICAAKEVTQKYKNVRFLIIGIGPDLKKLERLVKNYGIEKYVIFTGYRNDMALVYNDLDLVVQSSSTEGMPNVILESLLMELPVIATDVGGTSEVVSHGETGILIESGNLTGLVQAINEFIEYRQNMIEMAKRGREDVKKRFSHADRVKKLEEVYLRVFTRWKEERKRIRG
jgi:glycosyltransferase involved in cell wall biosynthesis